jgi:hypothetical protein
MDDAEPGPRPCATLFCSWSMNTNRTIVSFALLAGFTLAACGSTDSSSSDGRSGGNGGADAGAGFGGAGGSTDAAVDVVDATARADGLTCGDQTCGDGQVCVFEFCGGGPVQCVAPGDGGQCENGWQYRVADCPGTGPNGASGPGCFPPSCQNPPPRCADRPAGCGDTLSCSCITPAVCGSPACAMTSGRTVTCANL